MTNTGITNPIAPSLIERQKLYRYPIHASFTQSSALHLNTKNILLCLYFGEITN